MAAHVTVYRGEPVEAEPEADIDREALAVAADALLADDELRGAALVLLSGRSCTPSCPPGRRSHRLRRREFGPSRLTEREKPPGRLPEGS